jgi:hypothetical protein
MHTDTKVGMLAWRDSPFICALADNERHYGHIIREDDWIAFDATHPGENGASMRELGVFPSIASAKEAVERAAAVYGRTDFAGADSAQANAAGISVQ